MAEIRDPKRFYYAMCGKYTREAKQIAQKLALATTDEEDAAQWSQYKKVIKRWRALKKPEGMEGADDVTIPPPLKCKPAFNEEYVALTLQLKDLYGNLRRARSKRERYAIEGEIRALKKKRCTVTTYFDRETGQSV